MTILSPRPSAASRLMLALCGCLSLAACGALDYDHRGKIALEALAAPNGGLNEKAFGAALLEKISAAPFPQAELARTIEALGGECSGRLTNSMMCTLPVSGGFCQVRSMVISATFERDQPTGLRATSRQVGC